MQQDTVHLPTPQQVSDPQQPEAGSQEDTVREEALRGLYTDCNREGDTEGASRISEKGGSQLKLHHCIPQRQLGGQSISLDHHLQLPQDLKEGQQQEHLLERANGLRRSEGEGSRAMSRDRERRESRALQREDDKTRNLETQRAWNIRRDHRRRLRISPQDKTEERAEIREGGRKWSLESFWDCYRVPNWERPGGEFEDSYCRYAREGRRKRDPKWPQVARSEEECSKWTTEGAFAWETSEQAERVEEDCGRQTSEPWYRSSMEKSPVPNLTRGEKTQTRISWNNGDDEQLFIPLGGGIEGLSGEAHSRVGGEEVQPDIHGDKEKRKVEKDLGLQGAKRGSAGNALQDGFSGDSGEAPGEERLDDHSGHVCDFLWDH
ncbi:uncharacterized protein MONOS_12825 [Monocercomonoides exilis]|uniref:uncharacterized protein n=1 Tax=Monocercomonoides exilis TaxID=2049356 RepID=UPI003559C0FF|nr:hypothetical protein MONOS_12825 [Monocercomonoides exilis]|eukprot:MONOS_12825.1-p1 / transcript=MONOS_12825.1 / gene=MONOS_12825 / organism=Monocercomonoides_exilis_PA203 / gene_product=unspecified product / transcript_product=unspecified product / location=Mono_scaffold00739:12872-14002(+) / protein_length=377 / sequence_SO=supercontig / SO=protein_coding / is_pseudo=false